MTTDTFVLAAASASFLAFWVLHVIVFRRIKPASVLIWLLRVWSVGALVSVAAASFRALPLALPVLFLYTFLTVNYVLWVFGVVESSVHSKMLMEIASHPAGMKRGELFSLYNKQVILRKRLERFQTSGEIVFENGKYRIGNSRSPFMMIDGFRMILEKIFK